MEKQLFSSVAFALLCTPAIYFAQIKVTGIIGDSSSGYPLAGTKVEVKGTKKQSFSDDKGIFAIDAEPNSILVFTLDKYITKEVNVDNRNTINVQLEINKNEKKIDEVVLVAFGTQKKRNTVGSQASIKAEEISSVAVRDITTLLAGRLAGVVTTSRGGGPGGADADLLVRGVATFASSQRGPLIVVDGVPDRGISNLSPDDIESFTVLKDNSAAAVYGTRGANGVILINTKRGKEGRPIITAQLDYAVNKFTKLPEFLDGPSFMQMYNEGLVMRGQSPLYAQDAIDKTRSGVDPDLFPNVNWFDVLFKKYGSNRRADVSISGGAKAAQYYVSVGYYGEDGMLKTDKTQNYNSVLRLERFNFTSNVDVKLTSTTKVDLGISGYITNYNGPSLPGSNSNGVSYSDPTLAANHIFELATGAAPHIIPARYSNGLWPQLAGTWASPFMTLTQSGVASNSTNVVRSNLRVTQDLRDFIEGLSATAMFAFDTYTTSTTTRSRIPTTYFATGRDAQSNLIVDISSPGSNDLSFKIANYSNRNFYTEAALNYNKSFDEHEVSAMLLFNQSDFQDRTSRVDSYVGAIPYRQRNYVFRTTYGYAKKYFLEGNFSVSGSDNFSPSNRYAVFPSIGVGYMVSDEKFFAPFKNIINTLKLRYSYGLSGAASVNIPSQRFLYLDRIGDGDSYYFGFPSLKEYKGYIESRIGGVVGWSTSYRHNLGIEMNFLKNKLQLIVDLFDEKRDGILLPNYTIPYVSGLTGSNIPYGNFGITRNKGIEATLSFDKKWSNGLFVNFRGTFSYNKNLMVYDAQPASAYPWMDSKNRPIDQRQGYIALGLFKSEEEIANSPTQAGDTRVGDIKYKDLNGDGTINSYDMARIGYGSTPRIIYGLNFAGGYKNFDISLFFQGAGLVDFNYAGGFATTPFWQGSSYGGMYAYVQDRWTPDSPGDNHLYPRMSTNGTTTTNYVTSTWWIKRADYLRLKQAEIGYTFNTNAETEGKVRFKKMRIYLSGTNLFTISPWKFWDPELGDGRGTSYPNTTTYNIGIRLNF